jgi:uncharacterized protein YPO0396
MKDWFILKKFEIYNWWTFNWEIETYYLDRDITVVSWDNWSGKSTVVDALISLLVPWRIRNYNLSATEWSKKKSKNELSYIRWAYKNEETDDWIQTAYLRWNKTWESTFSVILGYFKDELSNKEVTLATFFRTTSNWIDKFYVVSESELYLKEDFINIINNENLTNPISKLKTNLKSKLDTKIYSKFSEYQEDFSIIFWLRQNAIELFNKVVSLKEIKDLNSFFRENMLDKNTSILSEFQECEKNYLWVKDIYEKIIDSEEKLKVLTPFMDNKKLYDFKNTQKKDISYYEHNLKNYTFWIEKWLIENKIKEDKYSLDILQIEKKEIEEKVNLQNNEIKSIENLLDNNDTTRRIKEIEQNILLLQKEEYIRELNYRNYENYINVLGFEYKNTEESFKNNIELVNNKKVELEEENAKNEKIKINYLTEKNELLKDKKLKESELDYFKKRDNLLPERLSIIRQKISRWLWIDENKLKFICELIKIKDEQKDWTMPIEKLLHSFWQELLVPEDILHIVNSFVDKNNLKWKLKYNKVKKDFLLRDYDDFHENLYSKLDIKHNSEFYNWIKDKILTRFNYLCLKDVSSSDYFKSQLVLTISWLIRNKNSYIKDDREFWITNYILWWDNKKKIELLEKEVNNLDKKIKLLLENISKIEKFQLDYNIFIRIYTKFEDLKTFSAVNYISIKKEINEKNIEIKNLKENDSELKKYREMLENNKKLLFDLNNTRDKKVWEIKIFENELKSLDSKFLYIENVLKQIDIIVIKEKFENSKYVFDKVNLDELHLLKEQTLEKIISKKDRLSEEIQTLSNKLNWLSSAYREHKMTISEKNDLLTNISSLEFWKYLEEQYHIINDEELYKYKERFEKEFRETLFIRLNDFYNSLENEGEFIKWKIEIINKTLKTINFSRDTFIQVDIKNNTKKSDWIEEFKKEFREKIIYKKELDMTDKIKAFEDIKSLMEKLIDKNLEAWRNNMIDVRNWFLFYIKENYINDETLKDIFESSSWKSGWQTIKLAYSVLAAALLYQFGIKEENESLISNNFSKSFRLVVIDEVFAKLDIDNSRYVLDLFKTLGLQLFIITPTNTINILEDYVKSIYFIANTSWEQSFKNKIDIKSRTRIEEKTKNKPSTKQEIEYFKKEDSNNKDLEEMRMEMFGK